MPNITLTAAQTSHMLPVLSSLVKAGWCVDSAPADGRLKRNGLRIILRTNDGKRQFRVLVFKITGSSRERDSERRVEITSTYQKHLKPIPSHRDVVLGWNAAEDVFVGLDPMRLHSGGATGNASTFIDIDALEVSKPREIQIRPRSTELTDYRPDGVEYQAYFKPPCLADYLLTSHLIHDGNLQLSVLYSQATYRRSGRYRPLRVKVESTHTKSDVITLVAPKITTVVSDSIAKTVEDIETSGVPRPTRKVSPSQLKRALQKAEEHGQLGERFVLKWEKQSLVKAGREDLAAKVRWISQKSVSEGYDILSYAPETGDKKYIEVKSTGKTSMRFFMSLNEWRVAKRAHRRYWIYRVIRVADKPQIARRICDPCSMESHGLLKKTASGYEITLTKE